MKLGKPGLRKKRILLYYFIGVVLPGIILGYMAFRGIRNDQAFRAQESLQKLEARSYTFFSEIDADLRRFMNEQTSDSIIYGSKERDSCILIYFIRDSTGKRRLISHQLLYKSAEMLSGEPERFTSSNIIQKGHRLEFAEKKYAEALRIYQDGILNTTDPHEKKEAMVASARLYKRLDQPEMAIESYKRIQKDYRDSLLNGQIPLALMAGLELVKINKALGEEDEIKIHLHNSLELMLHPYCEYDANQYEMFYQSFKEISMEKDDRIDSLFNRLDAKKSETDYLIWVLNEPNLMTRSNTRLHENSNRSYYSIPLNSDELQAMYLESKTDRGIQSGMVIDFPRYLGSVSEELMRNIDPDSSINVKVENIRGDPVFSRVINDDTEYLSFPFPEHLPKWELLLSENRPGFITILMNAGSGIYLFAFILIVLLMILGFVFILYSLSVELRLNKLKSEFISNVSHELKSPLTSIRMMTEMLHHNRLEDEARRSEYYSAMLEESEHLSHLIDNILDFSRIEEDRKKYEFKDLDLDNLTQEFIKSIGEMIREAGFEIRYSCPKRVHLVRADKNAILQVLYNLVDNAIKFSGSSKKIDIHLVSEENENQLSVKDYGIGIPVKDQDKIFDRFYRCRESQRSGIRGSGIGLTIVKKIVEDHGGYLTLVSSPGDGSIFTFRIPVREI